MIVVTSVALAVLILAALLALARVAWPGATLADRIVALDALLMIIVMGLAVTALRTGSTAFFDVLVVVSLLGFVGTVTVARFIERRGV